MMANPFDVRVVNPLEALMASEQGYDTSRKYQSQRAQMDARALAQQDLASGDTRGALARLIGAGDYQGASALSQYHSAANGVYGTPIYGTDPQGNTVLGAMDKLGGFRRIDTGGVTPTPGIRSIDTGTGTMIIDSRTGRPVGGGAPQPGAMQPQAGPAVAPMAQPPQQSPAGYIPKDVQGEAREKRLGTEIGERQAELGKAKAGLESSEAALDRMRTVAMRIRNDPALGRITGWMGMVPNSPGGPAANVQAQLETLKSQVAFGVLQAMREASKTGGALGNVSDAEGRRLEANLAALSQAQDMKAFQRAMDDIIRYVDETKPRLRGAFQQDYANMRRPQGQQGSPPGQPVRVRTPDEARRLPSGTPIILPDGSEGVVP